MTLDLVLLLTALETVLEDVLVCAEDMEDDRERTELTALDLGLSA